LDRLKGRTGRTGMKSRMGRTSKKGRTGMTGMKGRMGRTVRMGRTGKTGRKDGRILWVGQVGWVG
jgi:ATP-dependent RNA helicase DeaD